jgi:quercetin dioxygenase-like cupin family protein
MKMIALPLFTTVWNQVPPTEHAGERGRAYWRTQALGDIRVRVVEYTPGYLADHWCSKGHVVFCLEGEIETELADGRRFTLKAGMSYQVGDGEPGHRSSTQTGARLFIVD